jgi:glutathione S-transferase
VKLYHSPTSPFVRKVSACLIETGLHDRVERISAVGNPINPGTMPVNVNPLGKVPCLVTDDGMVLYDSRVITRYLDSLSDVELYPAPPRLWRTLTLEATADGMMEATLLITLERALRPADRQSPEWIEAQWAKVARALSVIEADWMDHLNGPLDMAQIAVAVACAYVDLRAGDRNWRAAHPALSDWQSGFAERESMAETRPVG